jgi:uncharacterized protein YciI
MQAENELKEFIGIITPIDSKRMSQPDEALIAIMTKHYSGLQQLRMEGKLIMAGPTADNEFGIIIIKATDINEAEAILKNDPSVKEGIMTLKVKELNLAFK